ncbi:hypothetical protein ACSBR2_015504 [Camellia fascicularis]
MASDEVPIPDPAIGIEAVLGADMKAKDAPVLPLLVDRPFDAATYRPRTHALFLASILRFEGLILGIDEDILLPLINAIYTSHLQMIARRIGRYGSISDPRRWYEKLSAEVRTLVDVVIFGPFYSGLIQMKAESLLYGALVERWWDTTDSFPFSSIGELTLTPYDFSMLTGLRVGVGGPILCDSDMTQWSAAQCQLLGLIPDTTSHRMVRYSWFLECFTNLQPATPDKVAQYTRGFLMYLIDITLFANREDIVGLYLLGALVYLPHVTEYDWGGTILATLYSYMSSISHLKEDSLGGYWRVWKLWVYTHLTSLASVPMRPIKLSVPALSTTTPDLSDAAA